MCKKNISHHTLQYVYRTLQFIVFLTLSNLNKTSNRAVTYTSYKMHKNRCVLLKSDTYVIPMQFTVLYFLSDISDKTQLMCFIVLLCLFVP